MDPASALVPLGVVVGAHGVRGELRVKLLNPASELLTSVTHVWLRGPGQGASQQVAVRSAHVHRHGLLLLSIEGCRGRDAAEALRGSELCVPRAELPELEPGECYLVDLVGMEVRLPGGQRLGVVESALEYPAAQVLRVRLDPRPAGGAQPERPTQGGIVEVPLLAPYLVEILSEQRTVVVDQVDDLEIEFTGGSRRR